MPPYRKPVSLLHTVSLFGCHIRSSKEGLISFLLTWPGIHSLVIGTGVTLEKWESRIFTKGPESSSHAHQRLSRSFSGTPEKKRESCGTCISKKNTHVPKAKKHACGRRHCRKQMGWLVTHDLVPKEHVPIMPGERLQQCRSPAFSEFANNNHNPSKLILIDHNFSSKQRIPRNARCISPRVFFFTNLTHWCFASPWGRPQCRTLWTGTQVCSGNKIHTNEFCIHKSVYAFTCIYYIYIANSNKHMYAHIIHIWFIIYTYVHAPPPVTVVNEGRVYQDPQVKTL